MMRKSRLGMALLPLVLLLLSGCYESQSMLLDPSAARQPVQGGDWTETRGGDSYHDRMIARSDGWYDFYEQDVTTNGNWEHHVVLVNTLGSSRGYVTYAYGSWDDDEKAYVYGIAVILSDGSWHTVQPNCDDTNIDPVEKGVALQQGATIIKDGSPQGGDVCEFDNTGSLLAALNAYAQTDDFWNRLNQPS
jgi:hypothetical protein